jgi:hypothetical protein
MTVQLTNLLKAMDLSDLNRSKSDARRKILALETSSDGLQLVDVDKAKRWIDSARRNHEKMQQIVIEALSATVHETKIARIVEKEGWEVVGTYEGSADLDEVYKKHLEYVKKEIVKTAAAAPRGGKGGQQPRGRGGNARGARGRGGGAPRGGGYQAADTQRAPPAAAAPAYPARPNGPSAKRPCAICKAPDHWSDSCPHK